MPISLPGAGTVFLPPPLSVPAFLPRCSTCVSYGCANCSINCVGGACSFLTRQNAAAYAGSIEQREGRACGVVGGPPPQALEHVFFFRSPIKTDLADVGIPDNIS